jgi:predicted nucleic acid-binding protein
VPAAQTLTRSSPRFATAATATDGPVLVVDTSAALAALIASEPPAGLVERLAGDGDLHAPHLIDIEVLHALRRMTTRGELNEERAADARTDLADLALTRYPHHPLSDRIWKLRHNLSAYHATFFALAEVLDATLITCDARLAAAPGHHAGVQCSRLASVVRSARARSGVPGGRDCRRPPSTTCAADGPLGTSARSRARRRPGARR